MLKGILSGLTVVLLLVGLVPSSAQEPEGLQPGLAMTTKKISVLAEAGVGSDKLATLEMGELVTVLEVDEGWAHIEYGDITGWVRPTTLINVNGPMPAPRGYHQMTYDVESDRVILFGGFLIAPGPMLDDTWSYEVSTNTWTKMAPAQSPPTGEGPLAYDIQSDRAILFLGTIGFPPKKVPSETWAYDLNTDTWTNLEPSTAPPPLLGARMAYDAESDRMILFGGLDAMAFAADASFVFTNETWAYDFDSNTWTRMDPAVRPPGTNYHAMVYDAGADRVIVAAPAGFENSDDTWLYDYNTDTWEARPTAEGPKHHNYSAMIYAAVTGRTILFGEGEPIARNDTWAYDFDTNTWTKLGPDAPPSKRGWHAMAYSSAAEQVVLFGGGSSRTSFTLETWIYDPAANTWAQVGP